MQATLTQTQGLAAFKEWAVSCDALASGELVMLFRKGGIKEKGHIFKVEHPHFFLYPTYEHQDPASIKPQYAEAHFNLARVNSLMGRCDLASAHLKEAMNLQPAYKQVARATGDFSACIGKPEFTAL